MIISLHEELVLVENQLREHRLVSHPLTALRDLSSHKVNQSTQGSLCFSLCDLLHWLLEASGVREVIVHIWSV